MDYLNKKQWHTGSIKNIARVWQKEQEATRQIQKQEQYRKKLLEEQHAHELKVAQVEAGHIPKSALEKMDWMYNPIMNTQQDTEQYLLGKQVDMQNLPQQQQQSGNLQDPNDTSNKYQAIVTEDVTNSTCENFTLIHEDPLFKIMQEEIKMKEKLMNNPLDVNMLMEEMRKQKELKKLMNGKDKKSKKKKDKKDKKEKKEKKDRKHRSKDEKESKKKKNKSRSRSRSSRKDKKENGSSKHKKDKKQKKSRSSSSDSSSKSSSSSKSRSPSKDRKNKRRSSRSNSENKKLRQKNRSNSRSLSPESKLKKMHFEQYLKKKVGNILVRDDDGELRPDFGLMKRMHRNNLKPEEKLKMTEEEKRERLKEMQDNAKQVTQDRLQEFKDDYKDIEYDNDASKVKDLHGKQNNPKFINDMNKEIYTGKKDVNSLAHQLSMNKTRLTRNLEEKNTFK